ncbi:3-phosphoshikimate 1-carboxyvinyltransferase, partial [bacterium]|nr:3-phosphoshikimate 1-carboxyvinyltransferase [bacterium]
MDRIIRPVRKLTGETAVPGDKSISHRALILGALSRGKTEIFHLSPGQDVACTRQCLRDLGIAVEDRQGKVLVEGYGLHGFQKPGKILYAGNSGTTLRLLSGILSAQPFSSVLTGDESLRSRPMARILEPLSAMGARISAAAGKRAPLSIEGTTLQPVDYQSPVASAQVKSCVLLAGLYADGVTSVTEPSLSRDHTERMLPVFGVPVQRTGLTVSVKGPSILKNASIDIPGDLSSAAFLMTAAALLPDSEIVIRNAGVNPTRTGILTVLKAMGCRIEAMNGRTDGGEPRADLHVRGGALKAVEISGGLIPSVIDEIPVLAVAAAAAEGTTVIRNASELRVKETDRIKAVADNLAAMGAGVQMLPDGLIINGPRKLHGAKLPSFGDHRIAMAFAVAGLAADSPTTIQDAGCVDISFPGFFDL